MKAVIQRISRASLTADGVAHASVGAGMLILLGVVPEDTETDAELLAKKCAALRIFSDENGKMNRSPTEVGAEALVVSQFTLAGDCSHGNRPYFGGAARPETAEPLYEFFCRKLSERLPIQTGVFGAHMTIDTVCDGPVTILIDTAEWKKQ